MEARLRRAALLALAAASLGGPFPASAESPATPASAPAVAAVDVTFELRVISKFPTCRGNSRLKLDGSGRLFRTANRTDCRKGESWSTPYPGRPVRTVSRARRAALGQLIRHSGFLDLPARVVPAGPAGGATSDGALEEIEVRIDGHSHLVTCEGPAPPAFRSVRAAIYDLGR